VKSKAVLVFFFLLTLVLYYPTIGAGFVTDVTGGIENITTAPFSDLLVSFGFPALNQLSIFLFYLLYYTFGTHGLGWYLVYCLLHAANAFLLYQLSARLLTDFKIDKATAIAGLGALLFLISPYQSEVLVWRACQNYLLSVLFILLSLSNALQYLETTQRRDLIKIQAFFLLALFTFELSLTTPLILTTLLLARFFYLEQKPRFRQSFQWLVLPQIVLVALYFCLNRLVVGTWIGHYGAKVHLGFSLENILGNSQKYFYKYLGFVRFLEHKIKSGVFNFAEQYAVIGFGFFALLIGGLLYYSIKKKKNKMGAILLFTLLFFIALLPVINLYFYSTQLLENDRYGYFASAFFYTGLTLLIFQLPGLLKKLILLIYFSAALFFLVQLNQDWKISNQVFEALIEDFRWHDRSKVYVLNVPDNYNGIYMFRIIGKGSGFVDALKFVGGHPFKGEMTDVLQYNMLAPTDGVKVERISDRKLKVIHNQWGNWFWKNGIGAGKGYETEDYKVSVNKYWYEIEFKQPPEGATFIYQDGMKWKEFKL